MKNFRKGYDLAIIIAGFTLLRIIAAYFMGLMPQDAYYTYYSYHPSLSYFDHPPMVAYMIWIFTHIFGKSVFTLHMADFTVTLGTLLIIYAFLRRVSSGDILRKAVILLVTAPFITILSINTTPDVPLLFFWALSLLLMHIAVNNKSIIWWLLAGIAAGASFDSKYTGIFLPAGLFLFLLLSAKHRKLILSGRFLLFVFAFAVTISPVVIWNIQNDFISFKYQSAERASGMSAFSFNPRLFAGYFGTQFVLALPLFFLSLFPATYSFIKHLFSRKREDMPADKGDYMFAASFALPMFVLFTLIALIYWVKINWIMPVYLSASLLAALYLKSGKFLRIQTIVSAIIHLALIAELVWMPVKVNSDDTWYGWDKLAQKTETLHKQMPDRFIFSDNSYKVPAALNFYLNEHVFAGNLTGEMAYQFALDDKDIRHLAGKDAIYVTTSRYSKKRRAAGTTEEILSPYFSSVNLLDSLTLSRGNGEELRKFYFYDCKGYRLP
jgi:hypothetical protein